MFQAIYKKFLTALDHIDYHPSQMQSNTSRTKRSTIYNVYGHYHSPTKNTNPLQRKFPNCLFHFWTTDIYDNLFYMI